MSGESLLAVAGILVGAGFVVELAGALVAGRLPFLTVLVAAGAANWLMALTTTTAFD